MSSLEAFLIFQLMDIDNDYYLVKFESNLDYNSVISKGPWVVYGYYLTVQSWSTEFSSLEAFSQNMVAWIRILGLSRVFYKRSILQEIGSLAGKVVKMNLQTDKDVRGQFARFTVQVNLAVPLIFKIQISNKLHRVKYESLPSICFECGRFGHLKDVCPYSTIEKESFVEKSKVQDRKVTVSSMAAKEVQNRVEKEDFGGMEVVKRRQRRQNRQRDGDSGSNHGNNQMRSRFNALSKFNVDDEYGKEETTGVFHFGK